jgi:hypothetical protein
MNLPPQDYAKYKWLSTSDGNTKICRRYAAGSEKLCNFLHHNLDGQNYINFAFETSLTAPMDASNVLRAARQAWAVLRFTIPLLASSTGLDRDGDTYLTCRAATDLDEVRGWVESVVAIQNATDGQLDTAVAEIWKNFAIPDETSPQTHLFVVPLSANDYGFLLRTSHVPFDGIGCLAVMDKFFGLFVKFLPDAARGERELASLNWGEELANLLPAYPEIVAPSEPLSGPDYTATIEPVLIGMATSFPVSWEDSLS